MTHILVSVSGGKDSTATLLVALEQHPLEKISGVFCDTGNEHPLTYEAVRYLEQATGVPIRWLKRDFSAWWQRRVEYVRDKWPDKGVPDNVVARVLAFMERGPTGNPYLDLCIIKGRFPSRKRQFCTQYLKTEPATEYALDLIERHGALESWQGVRAEESPNRANLAEREKVGGGLTIVRPIHKWTAEQVFAKHREHGIEPNPLYTMGMGRVGCMPCINARKDEVLEISKRFPDQIDRIEEWESLVAMTSKRQNATFFPSPGENDTASERGSIRQVVRWSKTSHGGKQFDFTRLEDSPACASSYGLCE
jgi:3'-phosphoadenosine 5'-phosphosulfate sulfotransferase (PAPS reductase)/FAD synthetase